MSVLTDDVVLCKSTAPEFYDAVIFAYHALTHQNTKTSFVENDPMQEFIKVLMDEMAERLVLGWLHSCGKFAETAVEKGSSNPDLNHTIWVSDVRGVKVKASIQTFLSTNKAIIEDILQTHWFSIPGDRICGINFSVVYWLQLKEKPRVQLPSLRQVGLIGWTSDKNLRELGKAQETGVEKRVSVKLCELRPLKELLQFLV